MFKVICETIKKWAKSLWSGLSKFWRWLFRLNPVASTMVLEPIPTFPPSEPLIVSPEKLAKYRKKDKENATTPEQDATIEKAASARYEKKARINVGGSRNDCGAFALFHGILDNWDAFDFTQAPYKALIDLYNIEFHATLDAAGVKAALSDHKNLTERDYENQFGPLVRKLLFNQLKEGSFFNVGRGAQWFSQLERCIDNGPESCIASKEPPEDIMYQQHREYFIAYQKARIALYPQQPIHQGAHDRIWIKYKTKQEKENPELVKALEAAKKPMIDFYCNYAINPKNKYMITAVEILGFSEDWAIDLQVLGVKKKNKPGEFFSVGTSTSLPGRPFKCQIEMINEHNIHWNYYAAEHIPLAEVVRRQTNQPLNHKVVEKLPKPILNAARTDHSKPEDTSVLTAPQALSPKKAS